MLSFLYTILYTTGIQVDKTGPILQSFFLLF